MPGKTLCSGHGIQSLNVLSNGDRHRRTYCVVHTRRKLFVGNVFSPTRYRSKRSYRAPARVKRSSTSAPFVMTCRPTSCKGSSTRFAGTQRNIAHNRWFRSRSESIRTPPIDSAADRDVRVVAGQRKRVIRKCPTARACILSLKVFLSTLCSLNTRNQIEHREYLRSRAARGNPRKSPL